MFKSLGKIAKQPRQKRENFTLVQRKNVYLSDVLLHSYENSSIDLKCTHIVERT